MQTLERKISIQENLDKNCAIHTINSEIDTIIKLHDGLDSSLTKALDVMQNAKGRIILTGIGKSGHIGKKIAASLASTGTPSFFVHPAEASHGDLGMLTDGDLRRCLSPEILDKKAIDLMTQNPKTISKDTIASEAMKIMYDKKITNIFVIKDNKPVGVIHIHDLLNNGVA